MDFDWRWLLFAKKILTHMKTKKISQLLRCEQTSRCGNNKFTPSHELCWTRRQVFFFNLRLCILFNKHEKASLISWGAMAVINPVRRMMPSKDDEEWWIDWMRRGEPWQHRRWFKIREERKNIRTLIFLATSIQRREMRLWNLKLHTWHFKLTVKLRDAV